MNPDCSINDHTWNGGGICINCDKRLRCLCGQFIREDGIDKHLESCRYLIKLPEYIWVAEATTDA